MQVPPLVPPRALPHPRPPCPPARTSGSACPWKRLPRPPLPHSPGSRLPGSPASRTCTSVTFLPRPLLQLRPLHPEGGSFRRCVTGGHTACRQRSALTPCTPSPTSPSRPCPQSQSCSSQPLEPQTRGHRRARPAPPLASFSPPSGTSHRTCLILLQLFLKRDQAP